MNTSNNDSNKSTQTSPVSTKQDGRSQLTPFFISSALIALLIGIGFGFYAGAAVNTPDTLSYSDIEKVVEDETAFENEDLDFKLFWEVWQTVRDYHVDQPVSEDEMLYGAIAGVVASLGDPYSIYFPPEQAEDFLGEINGSFEGIGAEIGIKNDRLTVIAPLSESPAEQAGLRAGDKILAIDSTDATFMTVTEAVQLIRGEKGTAVTLLVEREGESDPFDIVITRGTIQIESIKWHIEEIDSTRVAVLEITHFNSDTAVRFREAANEILLEQPDHIVVDLRNNVGGYLDAAVSIAGGFLPNDSVVLYEEKSTGEEEIFRTEANPILSDIPNTVLINGGSASAAEILAAALREVGGSTIIGETSFGKGTVQDLRSFEDRSSLKLTIAKWLTPDKNAIDGVGVSPDYTVERTQEDFSNDVDPQLDAAYSFITDRAAFDESYEPPVEEETTEEQEENQE